MKLEDFLNEAGYTEIEYEAGDTALKKLKKEAPKYFKLLKGREPLYRGWFHKSHGSHVMYRKKVRKDRTSKGMNPKVFKQMNKLFRMYGIPRRDQSVIGTTDRGHATFFGGRSEEGLYWLIVLGSSWDYAWVPSYDFNSADWTRTPGKWDGEGFAGTVEEYTLDQNWDGLIDHFEREYKDDIHVNEGFDVAYNKGYEIWFNTDEYIMIPVKDKDIGALLKK